MSWWREKLCFISLGLLSRVSKPYKVSKLISFVIPHHLDYFHCKSATVVLCSRVLFCYHALFYFILFEFIRDHSNHI